MEDDESALLQQNQVSSHDDAIEESRSSKPVKLSRARTLSLLVICGTAYIVWGALISLQPPFYPTEAAKKGASPSQVTHFLLCLVI